MIEITYISSENDRIGAIEKCVAQARKQHCTHYYAHDFREDYDIETDKTRYWFSILAFTEGHSVASTQEIQTI